MDSLTREMVAEMTNNKKRKEFLQTYKNWEYVDSSSTTKETIFGINFLEHGDTLYAVASDRIGKPKFNYPVPEYVSFYFVPHFGDGRTFREYHISENQLVEMLKDARKEILERRK